MSYIGSQPADSYLALSKQDFTTSATTTYTLSNSVTSASDIALFINFVRQEPETAYTASGVNLNLTEATSASDDMYCVFLGKAVQTVNPPNGSVGLSQLSATGTKDSTTFLRGDNSFAVPGGGKILQIVMGTTSTAVGTDSTSYIDTGLTASITPASSSNKVLVLVSQIATIIQSSSSTKDTFFNLVRGSTQLFQNFSQTISPTGTTRFHITNSMNYLDTPSTSSATTYKTQVKVSGTGQDIYVQKDSTSQSQIILMEVAG